MSKFIDVVPSHYAFNDIEELYYIQYESGKYFFSGIPYNIFDVAPVDVDIVATVNGQTEFVISQVVTPSASNPLKVFVDGIELGYDKVSPNQPSAGKTYVKLRRGVRVGGRVRLYMAGVPKMLAGDPLNAPMGYDMTGVQLPNCAIPGITDGTTVPFTYFFENGITTETLMAGGRQLKRVETVNEVRECENAYTVYQDRLYVHYDYNRVSMTFYYNINNSIVTIPKQAVLEPTSSKIIYTNRFFPDTVMTRGEVISIVNRLRKDLIKRYTDSEPTISTKPASTRFTDLPLNKWYLRDVLDLEDLKLPNNIPLLMPKVPQVDDITKGELKGDAGMTRAEAVSLLNNARKYFVHAIGR